MIAIGERALRPDLIELGVQCQLANTTGHHRHRP
jgi:hypothetical protein